MARAWKADKAMIHGTISRRRRHLNILRKISDLTLCSLNYAVQSRRLPRLDRFFFFFFKLRIQMSLYFFFFSYQIQRGAWLNVRVRLWFGSLTDSRRNNPCIAHYKAVSIRTSTQCSLHSHRLSNLLTRRERRLLPAARLSLSLQSLLCLPFVTPLFYLSSSLIASMKRFNAFFSFFFSSSFSPFLQ